LDLPTYIDLWNLYYYVLVWFGLVLVFIDYKYQEKKTELYYLKYIVFEIYIFSIKFQTIFSLSVNTTLEKFFPLLIHITSVWLYIFYVLFPTSYLNKFQKQKRKVIIAKHWLLSQKETVHFGGTGVSVPV
jgi:hypothetical protein